MQRNCDKKSDPKLGLGSRHSVGTFQKNTGNFFVVKMISDEFGACRNPWHNKLTTIIKCHGFKLNYMWIAKTHEINCKNPWQKLVSQDLPRRRRKRRGADTWWWWWFVSEFPPQKVGKSKGKEHSFAGWWFPPYFYFHPDPWGNDPIWRIFFHMGWNHQPVFFREVGEILWTTLRKSEIYTSKKLSCPRN